MEKELHIIKSAFSVFSENGIFDSSVDDVAKCAGVSKKTIYFIFKSKDTLVEKTFAWKMKSISSYVDEVIEMKLTAIEKMNIYVQRICESIESISMKAFQDLAKLKKLSVQAANEYLKKAVFVRFNKLLDQAQSEGFTKPDVRIGDALMSYWNLLSPFLLLDLSYDVPYEIKTAPSLSDIMRKRLLELYSSVLTDEGNEQLNRLLAG